MMVVVWICKKGLFSKKVLTGVKWGNNMFGKGMMSAGKPRALVVGW